MGRLSNFAKGAAKRGASAAGRDAARLARTGAGLARGSAVAGYDAATLEECPHCGERSKAAHPVCPSCKREKHPG